MLLRICSRCTARLSSSASSTSFLSNSRRALKTIAGSTEPLPFPLINSGGSQPEYSRRPRRPPQTLDPLPETPFTKVAFNTSFTTTLDKVLIPLFKAVAQKDDVKWWKHYTDLARAGNLKLLTHSQFSQILKALHPKTFFDNTHGIERQEFIDRVQAVKADMLSRGLKLTQADWAHILDCGRAIQRPDQTKRWWDEMIKSSVKPDVWCYNNYLASICRTATELQSEQPMGYMLDENGEIVKLGKTIPRSSSPSQQPPLRNMSVLATRIIHDMIAQSVSPNAYSYEHLITAYARDNNLDAANQVIERVWGLSPEGKLLPTPGSATHGTGSPLLPSQHTLTVIANAYGYDGALAAAISLVHAMSEEYKLVIPVSTWLSLLLWTCRRSVLYKRPTLGFLSPLAAPQLFKTMTSAPYNISPGVEAYYLMINHEIRRHAIGAAERLLVNLIKRYGPNGTDISPHQQYIGNQTLSAVRNWVPILCDRASRRGDKARAVAVWQRWQERFHLIETTGLMRAWDEVDESRKTSIPGVVLPATKEPTSFSTRKRAARMSIYRRRAIYRELHRKRKMHYLTQWNGAGQAMPLVQASNIRFGLGSPSPYFRRSHMLWRRQAQGAFGRERTRREKEQLDWKDMRRCANESD